MEQKQIPAFVPFSTHFFNRASYALRAKKKLFLFFLHLLMGKELHKSSSSNNNKFNGCHVLKFSFISPLKCQTREKRILLKRAPFSVEDILSLVIHCMQYEEGFYSWALFSYFLALERKGEKTFLLRLVHYCKKAKPTYEEVLHNSILLFCICVQSKNKMQSNQISRLFSCGIQSSQSVFSS